MKTHAFLLTAIAVSLSCRFAAAQDASYAEDLRFVQELRQRGDTDLALAFLEKLQKDPKAPAALKSELPIELALTRKAQAVNEQDTAKRLRLYEEARQELEKFRTEHPGRSEELKIDIAEITVLEGKAQLGSALAQSGFEAQEAELLKARTKFTQAADTLKQITDDLDVLLGKEKDKTKRARLERARLRAGLTAALNLFDIAQTYHRDHPDNAVLRQRAQRVRAASDELQKIASREESFSETWQARAWIGRCEEEMGKPKTAREKLNPIIASRNPAAADGRRLARYFLLLVIQELLQEGGAEKRENLETIIKDAGLWLTDYPRSRATPEGNGVRYLLAETYLAVAANNKTPQNIKQDYRGKARRLLDELTKTENEFTDRARHERIVLLDQQGVFKKPVAQLTTFDDCYYRAQYEVMRIPAEAQELNALAEKVQKAANEQEKAKLQEEYDKKKKEIEKSRQEHADTALKALEQGLKDADAKGRKGSDVAAARGLLTLYYLYGRKYAEAIRVGETVARNDPRSAHASRAAADALRGYSLLIAHRENVLKAGNKEDLVDEQGKQIDEAAYRGLVEKDRAKMLDFAKYCGTTWPKDRPGNMARQMLATMYFKENKFDEGVRELSAVTPDSPNYVGVRYQIADELLKADQAGVKEFTDPAPPHKKQTPRQAAIEVLRNIPETASTDPEVNRSYLFAKSRLGEELFRDKAYAELEAMAEPILKKLPTLPLVDEPRKNKEAQDYFAGRLLAVLLRAKYFRADAFFQAGKYKEAAGVLDVVLKDIADKKVPQLSKDKKLAVALLSLTMRTHVQMGDLARLKQVVDVFGKVVGEDPNAKVPEVLRQLVPLISVQVRDLKAKNDKDGLKQAVDAFTGILTDMQARHKQAATPDFLLVLAQCYAGLEQTDKAIELLEKIKDPAGSDMEAARVYQDSRIVLLRQLRRRAESEKDPAKKAKQLADAQALLDTWMGPKGKPGWAISRIDAHKERLYLYEAEGRYAAGFNKAQDLVKSMSSKANIVSAPDVVKAHYLDCYYQMVFFLYMDAESKSGLGPLDRTNLEAAANFIVQLEATFPDFGNEETKRRITDLLKTKKPLRDQYEKAKAPKK